MYRNIKADTPPAINTPISRLTPIFSLTITGIIVEEAPRVDDLNGARDETAKVDQTGEETTVGGGGGGVLWYILRNGFKTIHLRIIEMLK